jgi:hypothetical protein
MPQAGSKQKSSVYRGVAWHKGSKKWQANIWYDHKLHHLGLFEREAEAALAYDERALLVWGPNAYTNFGEHDDRPKLVAPTADEVAAALLKAIEQAYPDDPDVQKDLIRRAVANLGLPVYP